SEMKMYGCERQYANLLDWTLGADARLAEASQLLLHLGGPESIDEPIYYEGGYTVIHSLAIYADGQEQLNPVLALGPDIHRLGCQFDMSPEEESPFSLVLYSSWAFRSWLDALVTAGKGFEEFGTQEIQRNHFTHPGWEKGTFLNLSTYDYLIDYVPQRSWRCADCTIGNYKIKVQPHWRHFLERIKHGIDPFYSRTEASPEVDEEESVEGGVVAEAVDNTRDPTELEDVDSEMEAVSDSGSELEIESESESESESKPESKLRCEPEWELWDANPHDYPTTLETPAFDTVKDLYGDRWEEVNGIIQS
ncbi:MAG: hypothetical protein Q9192_006262, partial [Flavoplaca navasiana]